MFTVQIAQERHLVGSQSLSQGRCLAWKQDPTLQLGQGRTLAGYWVLQCSPKGHRRIDPHVLEGSVCPRANLGQPHSMERLPPKSIAEGMLWGETEEHVFPNLEPTHISWVLT